MKTAPEQMGLFASDPSAVRSPLLPRSLAISDTPGTRPQLMRVDWFRVITDLSRAGHSPNAVSDSIGVARTTLIGWKQGAEPRYTEGERLVAYWCKALGKDRSELHMTPAGAWWTYHGKA